MNSFPFSLKVCQWQGRKKVWWRVKPFPFFFRRGDIGHHVFFFFSFCTFLTCRRVTITNTLGISHTKGRLSFCSLLPFVFFRLISPPHLTDATHVIFTKLCHLSSHACFYTWYCKLTFPWHLVMLDFLYNLTRTFTACSRYTIKKLNTS